MSNTQVSADEAPELSARYGVRSIPTLMLFRKGEPVAQIVGAQSSESLKRWLAPHL